MSHQDTLQTCEEFLATLTAAETHVRVMAALQLDFSSVLKVYRDSLRRTQELLGRVPGPAAKAPPFVDLGGRDDTDEVLTNAVGAGAGSEGIRIGGNSTGQTSKNAPAVPIDDGPEGTTDDSAPLATDEVSAESDQDAVYAGIPEEEEEGFASASSIKAAPMNDDVVIMEEDDSVATEVMSAEQARARALAMAAAEDAHDHEPPTEESPEVDDDGEIDPLVDDDEHTLIVAEERLPALPEDTTQPGPRLELPPEGELDEEVDQASVDEVILSKAQAQAERSPAQGGQKSATPPPAPGAVKPKVKARQSVDKGKKDAATAKFYAASAAIPTIRDDTTPKPRAAAVRLGTEGQPAEMLGGEDDDEPIAIEGVEDEDALDHNGGDGLTLEVEEHEWEEDDDEPEAIEELDAHHLEEVEEHLDPGVAGFSKEQVKDVMERARRAAKQGNIEGAVNFFSDVLDADPDNVEAYIGRGRLYLDIGDYARAMSDFTVAEDLDHTSPEPQVAVGDLYFARKDYKKAIEYFDAALQMKPDHAMAFCRRGISHYYKKNYKQALGDLNEAVKLDKDIPNIQTFVSMAKKKAGKPGK